MASKRKQSRALDLSFEWQPWLVGATVILILGVFVFSCSVAGAHPPEHAAIHDDFYQGWMRPDNPNLSCCNEQDCAPVERVWRNDNGDLLMQRAVDGAWIMIPPEKIEQNRDSPDGRSHMCSSGPFVFCAIIGSGG